MEDLPEDVVRSILLRLSVQQLIRCRSVSKTWCALIKSSDFVHTHMALQRDQLMVVNRNDRDRQERWVCCYKSDCDSLSLVSTQPDVHVQGPGHAALSGECHGLVCLSTFGTDTLINPALRELKTLSPCPSPDGLGVGRSNILAIGFGYDGETKDYKVVRLYGVHNEMNYPWEAFIYELRTNSWRKLSSTPEYRSISNVVIRAPNYRLLYPSVFYKGFVHWTKMTDRRSRVITFNMTTELFGEMELPRSCEDFRASLYVLGSSSFACVCHLYESGVMNIWVMKEYEVSDSWTKLYSISQPSVLRPLSFWKNDKLVCRKRDGELACCHLPTGQIHWIQPLDRSYVLNSFEFQLCNQSLVSINQTIEDPGVASSGR